MFKEPWIRLVTGSPVAEEREPATAKTWTVNNDGRVMPDGFGGSVLCVSADAPGYDETRVFNGDVYVSGSDHARSRAVWRQFANHHFLKLKGNLDITNTELGSVILPFLEEVDGDIYIGGNADLRQVVMPNLRRVTGSIRIEKKAELHSLKFLKLAHIGRVEGEQILGDLKIQKNPKLGCDDASSCKDTSEADGGGFYMPSLTTVESDIQISSNQRLLSFDFRALKTVGASIDVSMNNRLRAFRLPALQQVGANCTSSHGANCGIFTVAINPSLIGFRIPTLQAVLRKILIDGNRSLESFGPAAQIKRLGAYEVTRNRKLCERTRADLTIRLLKNNGGALTISEILINGNKSDGNCKTQCPTLFECSILWTSKVEN